MSHSGRLASINLSRGGVPKRPVAQCRIGQAGLEGDRQADRRFHGGPDRAVTLFSADLIRALQAEGHSIQAGSIGENLTVSGLDWAGLVPGALLEVGAVRLQITKYASPCGKIAGSFRTADFSRVSEKLHPGWSRLCARVLDEGVVRLGDLVTVSPPPPQEAPAPPDGRAG